MATKLMVKCQSCGKAAPAGDTVVRTNGDTPIYAATCPACDAVTQFRKPLAVAMAEFVPAAGPQVVQYPAVILGPRGWCGSR